MKSIWKYIELLPQPNRGNRISLGEGDTPLLKSRHIGPSMGLPNLYFKLENLNPTGSYKDRFAASAVSHLLDQGAGLCLATSSGNTGAALAAYSAVAGIPCVLAVVEGAPEGKLQQMRLYGANTLMVRGFGIDVAVSARAMQTLQQLAEDRLTRVQISAYMFSPLGMAGVQTIAYELAEQIQHERVQVFVPAGGGGLCLAIAKGFVQWNSATGAVNLPKVNCVQPIGNDTIASSLRNGSDVAVAVPNSMTSISGLQVPNILDGNGVISACRATHGSGYAVSDQLIYTCQQNMALREGIYCEPAGAVALAGVVDAVQKKEIDPEEQVICVVTGHGFKDPTSTAKLAQENASLLMVDHESDLAACIAHILTHVNRS